MEMRMGGEKWMGAPPPLPPFTGVISLDSRRQPNVVFFGWVGGWVESKSQHEIWLWPLSQYLVLVFLWGEGDPPPLSSRPSSLLLSFCCGHRSQGRAFVLFVDHVCVLVLHQHSHTWGGKM